MNYRWEDIHPRYREEVQALIKRGEDPQAVLNAYGDTLASAGYRLHLAWLALGKALIKELFPWVK